MSADPFNAFITRVEPPAEPAVRSGPLAGRTLLIKDLIDTAGIRTTYGSRLYADHVPARSAGVVDRAIRAGAVIVGKANLPEFAWSVLGKNPWYGTIHNPTHPGKTTGGSSAGNAAALAAGLDRNLQRRLSRVPFTIGVDQPPLPVLLLADCTAARPQGHAMGPKPATKLGFNVTPQPEKSEDF